MKAGVRPEKLAEVLTGSDALGKETAKAPGSPSERETG
jgi:hypothetical protein